MCWVIAPASPSVTADPRIRSSRVVLPWSTWPSTATMGVLRVSAVPPVASAWECVSDMGIHPRKSVVGLRRPRQLSASSRPSVTNPLPGNDRVRLGTEGFETMAVSCATSGAFIMQAHTNRGMPDVLARNLIDKAVIGSDGTEFGTLSTVTMNTDTGELEDL